MLTLDTSALYAILLRRDPDHERMLAARDADPGPYFVPSAILAELGYMLQRRPQLTALNNLLTDLVNGAYTFHCGESDFLRIRELVNRYADLELGFSDAAVVACAERHGGRTLTADRRDFDIVARGEKTILVLP
ncbi:MAG: PIN domain-containing protein [Chloroflexi bacterium]|nr:PIN domain-containing protein [Chloroflexota bacterium]